MGSGRSIRQRLSLSYDEMALLIGYPPESMILRGPIPEGYSG